MMIKRAVKTSAPAPMNAPVIGSTDRLGGEAVDRPVSFQEVMATLYRNLGVNLDSQRLFDFRGRPYAMIDPGVEPLKELI